MRINGHIMILVCPSCESKFKVPDGAIPPEGRKVRCAQCGNAWHATKANELKAPPRQPQARAAAPSGVQAAFTPPAAEVDAGTAAQAAAIRRSVVEPDAAHATESRPAHTDENLFDEGVAGPAGRPDGQSAGNEAEGLDPDAGPAEDYGEGFAAEDDVSDGATNAEEDLEDEEYDEDDILARRRGDLRREAERKSMAFKRQALLAGWVALLVFVLGVLGALVFMKPYVTSVFPGTHQLYDFFASSRDVDRFRPDDGTPLTKPITETEVYVTAGLLRDRMRIETVDGQSQVVIVGELKNTGQRAANVPKVEISIKDGRGRVLDQWVYDPPGLVLRRLSRLSFETTRPVPAGMQSVEVRPLEGTRSENEAPSRL